MIDLEKANPGDRFWNKTNHLIIFTYHKPDSATWKVVNSVTGEVYDVDQKGVALGWLCSPIDDLDSEYKESMDEEELDKLANKVYPDYKYWDWDYDDEYVEMTYWRTKERECFKKGFRKKEELG